MKNKSKFLLIVLAVLVVVSFVAYQFMVQMNTLKALRAQDAAKQSELSSANEKTGELQQNIKDSQSDSWVQRMARDILGWVMPGQVKIAQKDK